MPLVRRLASTGTVLGCLGLATSLMAFAGWKLHQTSVEARDSRAQVTQSEEVLLAITRYRGSVRNFIASERGFCLFHDSSFLREREDAERNAEAALARLQLLVATDPDQSRRVAALQERFNGRLAAARALEIHSCNDPSPGTAALGVAGLRARQAAAEGLVLADRIEGAERSVLAERIQLNAQRQQRQLITVAASFGSFAAMTLIICAALYVESRRRRQSESRLSAIVENLPLTVWQAVSRLGRQRRFVYIGKGSLRDQGVDPELLLGNAQAGMHKIHEEDRASLSLAWEAAEKTGQSLDHTYRLEVGDGVRWVQGRASCHVQPDGSSLWTGYWADVTQQKELEQSLREASRVAQEASRAKSSFLAVMSHEIRTPLNGMLGLLELLDLTQLTSEQRATLAVVREAGRSLSQIIGDSLDIARVEAGRLPLQPVAASLADVVQRACQVHRGVALAKGLRLDWSVDPRLHPALVFDPLRVGQILNNFIGNALKFTAEGSVRVAAELVCREQGTDRVRLSVTDTGIGIAPEHMARIFEPFVQGAADTSARYGGSGLGLAICRQLAQAMGGDIRMHSTPGRGSRIELEVAFPAALRAAPATSVDEPQRRLASALGGRRSAPSIETAEREGTLVLVVDDHPTNRQVLTRQLDALGYACIAAEDAKAALLIWSSRSIGLILCDCYMPELNGFDLARIIREREKGTPGRRVPVLACTAATLDGERDKCIAAGMDACLSKPLGLVQLMRELDAWLPLPATVAPHGAPAAAAIDAASLEEFARLQSGDMDQLERAVDAGDFAQARFFAHRMAGAALMVGAQGVAASCRAVEHAARLENRLCMEIDLDELRQQTQHFGQAMGLRGGSLQVR